MTQSSQKLNKRTISTVYIGGGTPSTLSPRQLSSLFQIINDGIPSLAPDAEVTVEVNPATVSRSLLDSLRSLGTTRLSIGVQSFSDDVLTMLGRIHRAADGRKTINMARDAGFTNIGLDLMYAIPGQSAGQWSATLDEALALAPEHLSLYSLSIDEGSQFSIKANCGELILPPDETAADLYLTACDRLEQHGYLMYELSNFARSGFFCRHNLNYWARGEYFGIGAAAWSFLDGVRSANIADVEEYIFGIERKGTARSFEERTDTSQAASEALFLGLRTTAGVDLERFAACYGAAIAVALHAAIDRNRSSGLYEVIEGSLRLTRRGMLLANDAVEALLP